MASQVKDAVWLEWIASVMGLGSRQTQTAMLAPSRFHCLLDELPLHLIPQRQLQLGCVSGQQLILNPQCSILCSGEVPPELETQRHLLENVDLHGSVAWVRDPACNYPQPFWLGQQLESVVSRLRAGDLTAESVPRNLRHLLTTARILVLEDEEQERPAKAGECARKAAPQFREEGYAPLANLIHPFHIGALRRYYRYKIRHGEIRLGDEQSSRRYVAHNESVARFFHYQIANAIAAVVGEAIKPSYVYLASYLSGAELKKHIDREQCEFSVTLCLDFSPEPAGATSWPIRLDTSRGKVTVYQALGDGLLYRGTKVPHCRNVLSEGHSSTSIFFHYVAEGFSEKLE